MGLSIPVASKKWTLAWCYVCGKKLVVFNPLSLPLRIPDIVLSQAAWLTRGPMSDRWHLMMGWGHHTSDTFPPTSGAASLASHLAWRRRWERDNISNSFQDNLLPHFTSQPNSCRSPHLACVWLITAEEIVNIKSLKINVWVRSYNFRARGRCLLHIQWPGAPSSPSLQGPHIWRGAGAGLSSRWNMRSKIKTQY